MKEMDLQGCIQKPSDLKVCKKCNRLNWYENETCISQDCRSEVFLEDEDIIVCVIEEEYKFYKEEGFSEIEVDNIFIEV